ncbi:histidinol-phosphatase [Hansschlegelia plantiphila]|uniref:Histidinol-phosphatase n=1 Tax=Hansschlegelia plantiphila TaxID=374655 RepID=A0A9W6MUW5_9HYPH|nr:histidinol-phosphatase [Hansschlegelia plantiphila]GLK67318.1 histidinol-phosphatase [Hansschlegelia plantiphila]
MTAVDFAAFVDRLAIASGEAILPFFRTSIGVEDKSRGAVFDPVTAADRAGESVMRTLIRDTFPEHGVIGEEFGDESKDAEFVWVLDPIDGTRSFILGMPVWGTLIGLMRGGAPCFGLMHQPFIGERFSGDGMSATYRGRGGDRTLRTRPCKTLGDAMLMSTSPTMFTGDERDAFDGVAGEVKLTRWSADCYAYAMLASGHVDLIIEADLKPFDIVALIPIVEGAGGVITTWDGGPATNGGRIVAAGDRRLHDAAIERLARR